MPVLNSPRHGLDYYLVCFDASGQERIEADGTQMSAVLNEKLQADDAITDVFLISHGWNNDVDDAIRSYGNWIDVMADCGTDFSSAHTADPTFAPIIVGIHWPSLAFGDEAIPAGVSSGPLTTEHDELAAEADLPVETLVSRYAERIADNDPQATEALRTILNAESGIAVSRNPSVPPESSPAYTARVSPDLQSAFGTLFDKSGVGTSGVQAPPGDDAPSFLPQTLIQDAAAAHLLGDISEAPATPPAVLGPIGWVGDQVRKARLVVLREMSFWRMKALARTVGESGVHELVQSMQAATAPASARFHLMGHSFGCIVVTAAICGPPTNGGFAGPVRKIDSLFLVQGAMSLWSFAEKDRITDMPGAAGFYRALPSSDFVSGPIITTQSVHDWAVGKWYPLGAGVAQQVFLLLPDELPKYGGLGAFGIRGRDLPPNFAPSGPMLGDRDYYGFTSGQIYNLEASAVIKKLAGPSGAHSDIAHTRVAHVFWEAAISSF